MSGAAHHGADRSSERKKYVGTAKPGSSPTALRILLGAQLRQLREAKGLTRAAAGYTIRASESKMSRLELGRVSFKERDISDLLMLYGVEDPDQRDGLLALAKQANQPGWWHRYSDILPSWFEAYVGLEETATLIRTYEGHLVPGLLQTEDYARAVMVAGLRDQPDEETERLLKLRMDRQGLLTRSDPPRLWAVVDEAALRRPVGGPEVMRAQLEHLIAATKLPNVTLQVVPFRAGAHAALGLPFVILRFADPGLPDMVYLEQFTSGLWIDKRDEVDSYTQVMDRLVVQADDPNDTVEILSSTLRDMERRQRDGFNV
jgi:transcriptional regulator with XRE-family HTH domain